MIVRAAILLTVVAAHAAAIGWLATAAPALAASRAELPALLANLVAPPAPAARAPAPSPPSLPRPPAQTAPAASPGPELAPQLPPKRETAAQPQIAPAPAPAGAAASISPPAAVSPSLAAAAPAPSWSGVAEAALTPPRADASHLGNPAPRYPPLSRKLGEEGEVVLDLLVGADGRVVQARVQASSGHPRLDAAALKAAQRWRFVPARRGQVAIDSWYRQSVFFALDA